MSNKKFRLGKHVKKHDRRNLQFSRYLPLSLPMPPKSVDRASRLPANIGMMANDQYGDCTIAAAAHMVQSWTTYAERGTLTIPDADIVSAYLSISPNDQGAYMLDALNLWYKTGVGPDRIEGFVEVAPADLIQAKLAIQYFGALYIGMGLPDENLYGPWTTPTGDKNPYNGHAVCLIGYNDETQMFKVCTWGEIWDMSYEWYKKYTDEAYAALNDISLIQASGKTPSGFEWNTLIRDIAHIGDPIADPVPIPAPEPLPVPTPIPDPEPTPEPDPVSPPEPLPTPDPVVPQPDQKGIRITGVSSAYWEVHMNDVVQEPRHSQEFEAAEHAVNLLLANPTANVVIKHSAKYTVTRE
jgi:hypothetical protein